MINCRFAERVSKKERLYVFTLKFNVTDEHDVDKGISLIEKSVGPIDILVNNAGIIKRISILDMAIADYKQVIDVDLVAPLIVSKRVVPKMIEKRSGKIINMWFHDERYGRNTVSAYASAKGGLKLLTQNMTCEWAKYNIQIKELVQVILLPHKRHHTRNGHPFNDLVMTRTPAGRWANRRMLANAALFLASQASNL